MAMATPKPPDVVEAERLARVAEFSYREWMRGFPKPDVIQNKEAIAHAWDKIMRGRRYNAVGYR
jgi:hypothetical protein